MRGGNRGYDIAFYGGDQLATSVSNGLRFQDLSPVTRAELACSVQADQADAGVYFVDIVGGRVVKGGVFPPLGTLMFWHSPLLTGTRITALIASLHPSFDTEFNRFDDAEDDMQIHLLTLVPTTASEAAFAQAHSVQALQDKWARARTPLFDVERESVM